LPPKPPLLKGKERVISLVLFGCGYAALCNQPLIDVIRDF